MQKTRIKNIYTMQFYLYKTQKLAKLITREGISDTCYFWWDLMMGRGKFGESRGLVMSCAFDLVKRITNFEKIQYVVHLLFMCSSLCVLYFHKFFT